MPVYDELFTAYSEAVLATADVSHRLAALGRRSSSASG
jgi:hypothetical protein